MSFDKRALGRAIRKFVKANMGNQVNFSSLLSEKYGIKFNQSMVSRAISGHYSSDPDAIDSIKRICEYACINIEEFVRPDDPNGSDEIMEAIKGAWDGTPKGAHKLSQAIRLFGKMGPR